jgi:hypothetical protein
MAGLAAIIAAGGTLLTGYATYIKARHECRQDLIKESAAAPVTQGD